MKISDILARKRTFSFEMFPPRGEMPVETALEVGRELAELSPDFVSVTYSAGGTGNSANTAAVAESVQSETGVTTMAHLTCMGLTKGEVSTFVDGLAASGVENVLALRGDRVPGREPVDFTYASDLIAYLRETYGDKLCIGAACYPEGHVDCLDFRRSMERLKAKQDAGADFFVTQLFFDNDLYYRFREAADAAGITVPVVCGIMPFTSEKQVTRMTFTCGATLPASVVKRLARFREDPESLKKAGVEYACEQLCDLAHHGVSGLHVYAMNKPAVGTATHAALQAVGYFS